MFLQLHLDTLLIFVCRMKMCVCSLMRKNQDIYCSFNGFFSFSSSSSLISTTVFGSINFQPFEIISGFHENCFYVWQSFSSSYRSLFLYCFVSFLSRSLLISWRIFCCSIGRVLSLVEGLFTYFVMLSWIKTLLAEEDEVNRSERK